MNKLMILVAFLVVALVAAPAIAENGESTPPPPIVEASADTTPPGVEESTPITSDNTSTIPSDDIASTVSDLDDVTSTDTGNDTDVADNNGESIPPPPFVKASADNTPLEVDESAPITSDNTSTVPSDDITSTVSDLDDVTSTDTGNDTDVADDKDDGTVEDTAKKSADDVTKDEIVDAEDREDRIADRILADLKDSKKDKDEDDEDKDDANKDGVEQNQDQDADSGDANQDADVINTGDNVNQCVGILQVANTGNAQNATGITQFDSEADEIELENGSQITLTPQLVVDCRQLILQIVRGERPNESKISKAKLREVIQPRSGAAQAARTGGVLNQVSGVPGRVSAGAAVPTGRLGAAAAPKVLSASRAGQPKTASLRRSLPRTGGFSGYATLLGLSAGTLLVGGGLLLRRLSR